MTVNFYWTLLKGSDDFSVNMRKEYFDYTNLVQAINRTINKLIPVKERKGKERKGMEMKLVAMIY